MLKHETQVRVRYAETDQMGVLHHAAYPVYFELARTEMVRGLGLSYREIEAAGVLIPVVELSVRYHRPALYDEVLTVRSIMCEKPTVRLRFEHEMVNAAGKKVATGHVQLVFLAAATRRPCRCPAMLADRIAAAWRASGGDS